MELLIGGFHHKLIFSLLEFHINGMIQHDYFVLRFVSLNIILWLTDILFVLVDHFFFFKLLSSFSGTRFPGRPYTFPASGLESAASPGNGIRIKSLLF